MNKDQLSNINISNENVTKWSVWNEIVAVAFSQQLQKDTWKSDVFLIRLE